MYFIFVVQEEVGLRGARPAAFTVNPDFALVIESTTAADVAEVMHLIRYAICQKAQRLP